MASRKFIAVCYCCGKSGTRLSRSTQPGSAPPSIPGKCPSSPDGKHKPRWEEE